MDDFGGLMMMVVMTIVVVVYYIWLKTPSWPGVAYNADRLKGRRHWEKHRAMRMRATGPSMNATMI